MFNSEALISDEALLAIYESEPTNVAALRRVAEIAIATHVAAAETAGNAKIVESLDGIKESIDKYSAMISHIYQRA